MERPELYERGAAGVKELQADALLRVDDWLAAARDMTKPKDAADFSLAAKNAASVAVSCESILKMRNGGGR